MVASWYVFFFAHGRSPLVFVQGAEVLDWPSRSPDLNPIEHMWDELGRRVRQQINPPQTSGDLERALVEQWRRRPQTVFTDTGLLTSTRRRCVAEHSKMLEVDTIDIENRSVLL